MLDRVRVPPPVKTKVPAPAMVSVRLILTPEHSFIVVGTIAPCKYIACRLLLTGLEVPLPVG